MQNDSLKENPRIIKLANLENNSKIGVSCHRIKIYNETTKQSDGKSID